jgi:hypothetical protein
VSIRKVLAKTADTTDHATILLVLSCVTFFGCVWIQAFRGVALPFERNAGFVPLFLLLALVLNACKMERRIRFTVISLVRLNSLVGIYLLLNAFVFGIPLNYPQFAGTVLERIDLESIQRSSKVQWLVFEDDAGPVVELYGHSLGIPTMRANIHIRNCGIGKIKPPQSLQVALSVNGKVILLCY